MQGFWTAVKQRGKNGQSNDSATKACRTWRTSFGKKELGEYELEKTSRLCKAKTGVWCASSTMFFLTPKNVTSERPIALMPTLIRWLEALRARGVAKWQQKYRVDWDAADGRNGGAQQTVWEVLVEVERYKYSAGKEEQGAVALVQDLAKAFERVSLLAVWAWATHFSFPRKILRVLCGYFESCGCFARISSTRG